MRKVSDTNETMQEPVFSTLLCLTSSQWMSLCLQISKHPIKDDYFLMVTLERESGEIWEWKNGQIQVDPNTQIILETGWKN